MKGDSAFPHHSFALGMVLNGFPAFPAPPADRHPLAMSATFSDICARHAGMTLGVWASRSCDLRHIYVYIPRHEIPVSDCKLGFDLLRTQRK